MTAKRVLLAVSGGADSMAMMWQRRELAGDTMVVSVNHGLRPDAGEDAAFVKEKAEYLGMSCEVVSPDQPIKAQMTTARDARYFLLYEAAKRHQCHEIWIAHQQDDLAETVLMRFERSVGWRGLAGLHTENMLNDCIIRRPLLAQRRLHLRMLAQQIGFRDDPSNNNSRFERIQKRRFLEAHPEWHQPLVKLSQFAHRWRSRTLKHFMNAWHDGTWRCWDGSVFVHKMLLQNLDVEAQAWLLDLSRSLLVPGTYPRTGEKMRAFRQSLLKQDRSVMGFCVFQWSAEGLLISLEKGRKPPTAALRPLPLDESQLLHLFHKHARHPI
ncbi:MAG: tRNA lysidine(34) synthetase TilS [Alphaproteobacteria bacterium]